MAHGTTIGSVSGIVVGTARMSSRRHEQSLSKFLSGWIARPMGRDAIRTAAAQPSTSPIRSFTPPSSKGASVSVGPCSVSDAYRPLIGSAYRYVTSVCAFTTQ